MRVVYFGSPRFSADILSELAQHFEVVAAYTMPDKVRGRGKELAPTPVKAVAEQLGIPVETPATLRDAAAMDRLRAYNPDIICIAAYGAILSDELINLPPLGCINVHASLLPRWRGAAPIERAILAGDEEVGVCIMRVKQELDAGDYCVRRSIPVGGQSTQWLTEEIADLGARALITALSQIESGNVRWVAQDESQVTYAEKIVKGELDISPDLTVEQNLRNVQASSEMHPSKCTLAGRRVRVLAAREAAEESAGVVAAGAALSPGQLTFVQGALLAGCADGALAITSVKPDGKRDMAAAAFATGVPALKSGVINGGFSHE